MGHLENHEHAFIDENNKVINVAVFLESAHDSQLLEDIRTSEGATQVICCCTFGAANVGDTWNGTGFQFDSPYPSWTWDSKTRIWNPPIAEPEDGEDYAWDEETKSWKQLTNPRVRSLDSL